MWMFISECEGQTMRCDTIMYHTAPRGRCNTGSACNAMWRRWAFHTDNSGAALGLCGWSLPNARGRQCVTIPSCIIRPDEVAATRDQYAMPCGGAEHFTQTILARDTLPNASWTCALLSVMHVPILRHPNRVALLFEATRVAKLPSSQVLPQCR